MKNYRSIASCDVQLQPLTFLVGPNGSGKSNFLDGLRFLVHSMHAPFDQVLEARGGMSSILRNLPGGKKSPSFSVEIQFELSGALSGRYILALAEEPDGGFSVKEEHCHVGGSSFAYNSSGLTSTAVSTPASTGDRPILVSFGTLPEFAPVFNLIAGITMYSPNPEKMRKPAPSGAGRVLSRDGSNAADVLARLQRTSPETLARLRRYLTSFNPEFSDVTVTEAGGNRWLAFIPASNPTNWRLNSSDVSEGTLRATAILIAIFQAHVAQPRVSLIGLEEPESNLHPAAAGVLLDALLEISTDVPVVVSTHSADLLDRKTLPEGSLLVVSLHDGTTSIRPLDDPSRSIIRDHLYTAGELLRNNQLNASS